MRNIFVQKSSLSQDIPFLCEQMQILLRAGFSLPQVFENLSKDFGGPGQKILQTINISLASGEGLSSVLCNFITSSSQIYEIAWFQTLQIHLRFGGNIIQALESLREIAQQSVQDERMKKISFAQGKASLVILVVLWFFSLLFLRVFSPEAFALLFQTIAGTVLFLLSFLLFVLGLISIRMVMSGKPLFWQRRKRQLEQFQQELPIFLHLVSLIVLSGTTIHYGFQEVLKMKGLLLQEKSREIFKNESFFSFSQLTQQKDFIDFISFQRVIKRLLKSQEMGGSAAPFLQYQIKQLQMEHRQYQEEKARLAVIKISLPLALFIFPSLLLLYVGPSLLLFLQG